MNERIRELMLEVGFVGYGEDLGSYNIPVPAFNSRMEKFAELIVAECMEVFSKDLPEPGDDKMLEVVNRVCNVAEHFGVKN